MTILTTRNFYKPFEFPWAYDLFKKHEQMHWLVEEVPLETDIKDWNNKLSPAEKTLLTQLFRFFTQADIDVAGGYTKVYLPLLGNKPELTMMMASFAAREAIHIDAYSTLIETLGMDNDVYKEFLDFAEMQDKHNFTQGMKTPENTKDFLRALAVYSGFTEGVQLFSSFAILMNFERFNKMKGMCNIVRWSIRDETLHVEGMTRLFKELLRETPSIDKVSLGLEIQEIAGQMVALEDKFIDLCFKQGGVEGLTKEEMKTYIRFLANRRFNQLGFREEIFLGVTNPLPWLDWVINGKEHTNFFEARATDYSKGTLTDEGEIQW